MPSRLSPDDSLGGHADASPGAERADISAPAERADSDACPGALRLHDAADGPLARVRIPGGRITGVQLAELRAIAAEWGDGHLELTSRANLQLRALRDVDPVRLAGRLSAVGLLPSSTHELVRNIAGSPLLADPTPIAALDEALCADPALAALPGRFLFAIDDGTGDVARSADVAALPDGALLFAGRDLGLRVDREQLVPALIAAGHAFLALAAEDVESGRRRPWRVRELADGPARMAAVVGTHLGDPAVPLRTAPTDRVGQTPADATTHPHADLTLGALVREPIGVIAQADGRVTVGALVPLGMLGEEAIRVLEAAATLVVTPWRGVVVPDVPADQAEGWLRKLARAGLETAAGSRWVGVTSCAGRPGCAKALADVRADADATTRPGAGLPVHWVGCGRGCGSPAGPHVRVEATDAGYAVSVAPQDDERTVAGPVPATEVATLVAAVRKG
ncbi:precorrin-3B synthase [Actinoplanes sp. NPDC051859]|uniref:precorrin-3B synthase n=1 Tax=Actinoplanes sp. NPDC051859 TaxID=3363909 RepID=UPI0037A77E43